MICKNNRKKMIRIAVSVTVAISLLVTVYGKIKDNDQKTANKTMVSESKSNNLSNYGAVISVKDIKDKYKDTDEELIPLYNVAQDECFEFPVSSELNELDFAEKVITVHTDSKCLDASKISTYNSLYRNEDQTYIKVRPLNSALCNRMQKNSGSFNWGSAPIYYLAIHYNMESDQLEKLDHPIIIPFTIRQDIQPPNVKGVIDEKGCFKLAWNKVEGAEKYVIYQLKANNQETGEKNLPFNGAENGYNNASLTCIAETTNLEFSGFSNKNDGLSFEYYPLDSEFIYKQNQNVCGEYFVSAIVNENESGFAEGVTTSDLNLPNCLDNDFDKQQINGSVENVTKLPLVVDVINVDGSITKRNVLYKLETEGVDGEKFTEYTYEVEGTALSGLVKIIDYQEDFPKTIGHQTDKAVSEPQNNIQKVPDKSVDTILKENQKKDSESLIQRLQTNTSEHVEKGNKETISKPNKGVQVFGDSAEEEWIALNLLNGKTEISVEGFPDLQNPNVLEDVFYKVYYQNPYIVGVYGFEYDYKKMSLNIKYLYDSETIKEKQKEIYREALKIKSSIISKNMTDEEKRLAIYQYFEENCSYDSKAVIESKKNGYVKSANDKYEDSFNAYGIIVKKKGVCQSYAYAYKLLCGLCGIESKVITGYLNGNFPHSWNAVEIEGDWFQIDCTNNGETTGIPYFLYNADNKIANDTVTPKINFLNWIQNYLIM